MKSDPICAACTRDCKQPAAAKLVSCPHFSRSDRNLDMFDMAGEIDKDLAKRLKSAAKKRKAEKEDK